MSVSLSVSVVVVVVAHIIKVCSVRVRGAVTRRREKAGSTKKEKKRNTGCFNFATDGGVGGAIAAGSTWTIAGQAVADERRRRRPKPVPRRRRERARRRRWSLQRMKAVIIDLEEEEEEVREEQSRGGEECLVSVIV